MNHAAVLCMGLLGLLVFGLGLAVSTVRGRTGRNFAHTVGPTARLYKRVRAHGNAVEYAPMLALLTWYLGSPQPGRFVVWTFVLATLCRYLHALGMILAKSLDGVDPLRFMGALGTYVTGIVLVVAVLLA